MKDNKNIGHIFCGYPAIGKTSIGGKSIQIEDGQFGFYSRFGN